MTDREQHEDRVPAHILWIDVETTGLDPERDHLLEIAYVLTRFEYPYEPIRRGAYLVEGPGATWLRAGMLDPFLLDMHERSGLRAAIADQSRCTTLATIEQDLLTLSEGWPTEKDEKVVIAGNSPHFDLGFVRKHLPAFARRLSYRTFDASGFYRVCLSAGMPSLPKHVEAHRAEADVERSIDLMRTCVRWFRTLADERRSDS